MQEVQIIRWCDHHLLRDGVKEGARSQPRRISIDGVEADVDGCDACDATYIQPLVTLLRAIGSRATQPPPAPEVDADGRNLIKAQCPMDGIWLDTRSRVSHVQNKHPEIEHAGLIDWRYREPTDVVWMCNCGLNFPVSRGRDMHARHKSRTPMCGVPEDDTPVPAKRPI